MSSTREIRLAFLVGRLVRGGAELQMLMLARGLVRRGYRVDFVCRSGSGSLDEQAQAWGATVRQVGGLSSAEVRARDRYLRRASKHVRWITTARRERYDIVDAWLHPNDVFASLTRPLTRVPVVVAGRRNLRARPAWGPLTAPLYATANRMTDVVITNAQITAARARQEAGLSPERVRVIRAGVELPRLVTADERRAQRAALGVADDDLLIGSVGNFRSMKRHDLLIEAVARLSRGRHGLRLVLVGDGERRPAIEQQIRHLGLEERVVLAGSVTDLTLLYASFDLFVQASNSESLPNVLLEASAARLPIVATAAGGSGEVIEDGVTGLLVPVDDLDQLAAAMGRALDDVELRRRMAVAARAFVEREYGVDRMVSEFDDHYREQLRIKGI